MLERIDVVGVPLIRGAVVVEPEPEVRTVSVKAGSEAVARPSLTVMTMFENVPTLPDAGVPDSVPFDVLKLIHEGRFEIE